MTTRITVAHSPDSDDAFMFYGLASNNVDTGGIEVEQVLSDIETLNRAAFDGKYEVTAVSFHAYAHLADKYALLPHGASMGDNYGPIVVAREDALAGGVVGRAHRRPAAAARRQHHPARSRARDDPQGVEAAARQYRLGAVAPRRRRRIRAAVRPRPRQGEDRQVRRHVRERPDAGVRRARPPGGRAIDDRRVREGAHSQARAGGVRGVMAELTPVHNRLVR